MINLSLVPASDLEPLPSVSSALCSVLWIHPPLQFNTSSLLELNLNSRGLRLASKTVSKVPELKTAGVGSSRMHYFCSGAGSEVRFRSIMSGQSRVQGLGSGVGVRFVSGARSRFQFQSRVKSFGSGALVRH